MSIIFTRFIIIFNLFILNLEQFSVLIYNFIVDDFSIYSFNTYLRFLNKLVIFTIIKQFINN